MRSGGDSAVPEVRIEPDAHEYIASQGGAVTLRGSRRHGCCGGTAFVPVAEPCRPDDPERFRSARVGEITVFVEKDVAPGREPLVIGLDRLWRWQRLRVEGTAIWM